MSCGTRAWEEMVCGCPELEAALAFDLPCHSQSCYVCGLAEATILTCLI